MNVERKLDQIGRVMYMDSIGQHSKLDAIMDYTSQLKMQMDELSNAIIYKGEGNINALTINERMKALSKAGAQIKIKKQKSTSEIPS